MGYSGLWIKVETNRLNDGVVSSEYLKPIAEEEKRIEEAEKKAREEQERIYKQLSEGNHITLYLFLNLLGTLTQILLIFTVYYCAISNFNNLLFTYFPLFFSLSSTANSDTILKWIIPGPDSQCSKLNKIRNYFSCNNNLCLSCGVNVHTTVLSVCVFTHTHAHTPVLQ